MSFKVIASKGRHKVVAFNAIQQGVGPSGASMSTAALLGTNLKSGLLEGIIEESSNQEIQAIYRDIYFHDPIAGAAVDLKANLPWSDFNLIGATEDQLKVFMDTIERLNLKTLHVEMSTDQMVSGAFLGSLVYKNGGFSDVIPFDYAYAKVTPNPLYSEDPVIQVEVSPELKSFVNSNIPAVKEIHSRLPQDIMTALRTAKEIDLDPLSTIYLPRTSLSTIQTGVSYFRRILPLYLIERVLYRGTLSEVTRRQRSTLHITAGDEDWIPTSEELSEIVGLFQSTEMDPISSVVATRNSIQTQEIRSAGDFFKWTDVADQLSFMKMRALGINESFLSGDASYNTLEVAMSTFIEDLRTYRERETRRLYYDKLFPLIAVANNFYKEENKTTATRLQTTRLMKTLNDTNNLVIPEVHWHKPLQPEADQSYMEILSTLEDKGLPVPLRMWAAAGGYNLDKILADQEADADISKKVEEYKKVVNSNTEEASLRAMAGLRPQHFLNRDYGEAQEIVGYTVTGKKKYIHNQKLANEKMNMAAAKALTNLADPNKFQDALKRGKK